MVQFSFHFHPFLVGFPFRFHQPPRHMGNENRAATELMVIKASIIAEVRTLPHLQYRHRRFRSSTTPSFHHHPKTSVMHHFIIPLLADDSIEYSLSLDPKPFSSFLLSLLVFSLFFSHQLSGP